MEGQKCSDKDCKIFRGRIEACDDCPKWKKLISEFKERGKP